MWYLAYWKRTYLLQAHQLDEEFFGWLFYLSAEQIGRTRCSYLLDDTVPCLLVSSQLQIHHLNHLFLKLMFKLVLILFRHIVEGNGDGDVRIDIAPVLDDGVHLVYVLVFRSPAESPIVLPCKTATRHHDNRRTFVTTNRLLSEQRNKDLLTFVEERRPFFNAKWQR